MNPGAEAARPLSSSHPAALIATWFGVGRLPKAPGSWGSLSALIYAWLLQWLGGPWLLGLAIVAVFAAGLWAASLYAQRCGRVDPPEVVVDEVVGQWIALLFVPLDPVFYAVAFMLFRLADILKPWPANWAERRLRGGLGIMLDDVVAGLYAAIVLFILSGLLLPGIYLSYESPTP